MSTDLDTLLFLLFIFMLAMVLGFELISKVPSTLHTPLMSGSNAISGITIVGAILAAGAAQSQTMSIVLGTAAVALATINVVGGYLVTDRMLGLFRKKGEGRATSGQAAPPVERAPGSTHEPP
jgi:NAD(P) transhydrogenase subunit alpha